MADNIVQITIEGKDEAGPAFTAAAAQEKAFARAIDQSYRTQESALRRVTQAESAHTRATQLLDAVGRHEAEDAAASAETHSRLGGILSSLGGRFSGLHGILGSLGGAFASLGASVAPMLQSLPLVGSGLASIAASGAAGLPIIAALAAAFAALVLAAGPLVAGLGLITVGVATFAAGAVGEISKVIKAHQALLAAQQAYAKATTGAGRASALAAEQRATENLTGSEKGLMGMLTQVGAAFGRLKKAVRPQVIAAFGEALKIIHHLMPALTPLAQAAGKALDGFLKNIDQWLQSRSGKKFIHWMETEGPKALATFGHAMTGLVHGIGIVLYWWDRLGNDLIKFVKSNAPAVEHAFGNVEHAIGNVVHAIGNVVHAFGNVVHAGGNVVHAIENVIHAVGNVIHAFANVDHAAQNVGHAADNVSHAFGNMTHAAGNVAHAIGNIVNAISGAIGWFSRLAAAANHALGGIPGKVLGALGFAAGGIVGAASGGPRAGMVMVGERGPELVKLPAGSHVYNNAQSQQMAGGGRGGGDVYNISVTVAPGAAPAEVGRQIAYYLAEHKKRGGWIYRPAGF